MSFNRYLSGENGTCLENFLLYVKIVISGNLFRNVASYIKYSNPCITGNHLDVLRTSTDNPNFLTPDNINQRRNSRRPSILPVPDMFTSSSLNIPQDIADEGEETEDELEDDVPWRSPSEKIA